MTHTMAPIPGVQAARLDQRANHLAKQMKLAGRLGASGLHELHIRGFISHDEVRQMLGFASVEDDNQGD